MDTRQPDETPEHDTEAHFQAASAALARPDPPAPLWWKTLIWAFVAGTAAVLATLSPEGALAIIAAMLLHELGHWIAMRLLGFREEGLFFLPFFEAGLRPAAAPVPVLHRALAMLAGPLPGLLLAAVIQGALHPPLGTPQALLVGALLLFNGVNLLPLGGLDAGRLLEVFRLHARPLQGASVLLLPALVFLALGWAMGSWMPVAFAPLLLLGTGPHYSTWRQNLGELPPLPPDLAQLDETQRRALHGQTTEIDPEGAASVMRELHQRATEPRPGERGWLLLAGLHAAGVLLACFVIGLVERDTSAAVAALVAEYDGYKAGRVGWDALIETWKAAPPRIQGQAMQRLTQRWVADSKAEREVPKLAAALALPLSVK